ncbi:hypothetical protein ACVFMH_16750 [Pseudomonas aeruginosa]
MSSTQHQLIEQCATRLRGIIEALDNIHDTSPHRWSTDLDDVHSSAESLLALIKDQAPARSEASFEEWLANELEGEDGQPVPAAVCDIALARRAFNHWPKLEQPAKVGGVRFSAGVSSRLVVEAAQRLYEFESTPEKEAERIERLQAFREQLDPLNLAPHAKAFNEAPAEALKSEQAEAERPEVVATVKTKSFGRVCDVASPDVLYSHCSVGDELMTVSQHERIVGELRTDAQRWREQFDCMQLQRDHHRERADAALARFAELEKQEPVAWVEVIDRDYGPYNFHGKRLLPKGKYQLYAAPVAQAQHSAGYAEARQCVNCRHIGINDSAEYAACHDCRWTGPEPDEDKCPRCGRENCMVAACPECGGRYELVAEANITAPPAQAQHCVPEVSGIGRDFAYPRSVVLYLRTEPTDDDLRAIHDGLRSLAAAPGKEVPQAWLDVQAERRRQVTAEGWTPEHDDAHSHGQIARAAACYALAGSSAPNDGTAALLVSLAWPWDEQWWKPTSARRDLVKACALGLAEIERLDRAGISQNPQPGATTASS